MLNDGRLCVDSKYSLACLLNQHPNVLETIDLKKKKDVGVIASEILQLNENLVLSFHFVEILLSLISF